MRFYQRQSQMGLCHIHNDTAEHPSHKLRLSNGLTWGFSWATAGRQMNDRARTAQEDEMAG
jgi:hypothetical protein